LNDIVTPTADESHGFGRVVALNEACKQLLARSFQVNLLALDAMVQSKRGGGRVRGFDEVSSQMRMWSRDLHAKLEQLGELSAEVVQRTSLLTKEAHVLRLIGEAVRSSGHPGAQRALDECRDARDASSHALAIDWRKIMELLSDLDQLGMMACVLSRSAMIEACGAGPELRTQLDHVSREFYANALSVVEILAAALKAMQQQGNP
jgi:hypothetical protein